MRQDKANGLKGRIENEKEKQDASSRARKRTRISPPTFLKKKKGECPG
jgi:hypothetical protein